MAGSCAGSSRTKPTQKLTPAEVRRLEKIHDKLERHAADEDIDKYYEANREFHRAIQEDFFAEWEIEGTVVHRVGPGDSLWVLSTRRYDVPIWLLRQYNPDVDLDALSKGMNLTIPKLRQRDAGAANAMASSGRG